ncbi:MAG: 2-amino-4-hydroxy-6-hydroxymethyldihydropteridine diphosphokinase [Nitrospirae bacterium]|nr:2-amino-4-hydroxy-6-hydroxymethyldihydropteridine diphosphokinase [Nitrospirota bacterium]
MPKVFLGLGSNLGDRKRNIQEAVRLLEEREVVKVVKVSSLCETEPEGVKDQPFFLNGVLEMETELSPRDVLDTLKAIERRLGRKKGRKWGPRIIDLDILLYGDLVIKEEGLEIPHPLLPERAFVLTPLVEIAPETVHPGLSKTISYLQKKLKNKKC